MSHFLHKHRRFVLVFTVIAIAIPFAISVPGFDSLFGGGNPSQMPTVVAQVGEIPITSAQFLQQYNALVQARTQAGQPATAEDLVESGMVEVILERLVSDALLTVETEKRDYRPSNDYLVDLMKKAPDFQNEKGEFDPNRWNQFVEGNQGANWNVFYDMISSQLNRQLYTNLITASARVLESDLRDEFERSNTKMKVRYVKVEPKVELTEEQLRAHYDSHLDQFMTLEQRRAKFVAISLEAPEPPLVRELVDRARAGEDFETLARQYSEGPDKDQGGNMEWVLETPTLPEHQKMLFQMAVGEVSEPVEGPTGIHIYKVLEDRVSQLAGKRDVRACQIVIRPKLADEEKTVLQELAQKLVDRANETGDFDAAAQAENHTVVTTSTFDSSTTEIENVDSADIGTFRRAVNPLEQGTISSVIEGRKNLYVAKVEEVIAPRQQTFEEAKEKVDQMATIANKQTPEYQAAVDQYVVDVEAKAKKLDEIPTLFPELAIEIKETNYFSRNDFLFSEGITWQTGEAFALLETATPGEMRGPIADILLVNHWLELVDRQEPDETVWATEWTEQEETLRSRAMMEARQDRYEDYFLYLREQANKDFLIQQYTESVAQLIGFGAEDAPTETPASGADAADAAAGTSTPVEGGVGEVEQPTTPAETEGSQETPAETVGKTEPDTPAPAPAQSDPSPATQPEQSTPTPPQSEPTPQTP